MTTSLRAVARAAGGRLNDPGATALKKAVRAAIAIPAVLVIADTLFRQSDSKLFAVFGSLALLVFADFRGSTRMRLTAYVVLSSVGAAFIVLGTLCSQEPWLGAAATGVAGLVVLSTSALSPYIAMAGLAPLLTFIVPVTLAADPSVIPQRLLGWALACGASVSAALLLWPPRPGSRVRALEARACRDLAALVGAMVAADPREIDDRAAAARSAVASVRRTFASTPYSPAGAVGPALGLWFVVDELDWFLSLALSHPDGADLARGPFADESGAALAAVRSTLDASADLLEGRGAGPDIERLEAVGDALSGALARAAAKLPVEQEDLALVSAAEPSFRVREMSLAARVIGANVLRAAGRETVRSNVSSALSALDASWVLARGYGSMRSVLLRNSLRGAVALALAVLIVQEASLQHGFWVALGVLSVLRSNALGTGATVVKALTGTAFGLLVGVAVVVAAGTGEGALWALFPVAVLLAAYAPQAISFAAGQAGFTLLLLILFDLIQPTGWTVGLVRLEDVAIGFAVSIGVGALFWPRGAAALMRGALATSYARNAAWVAAAIQQLFHGEDGTHARLEARAAAHRLDDVFRQTLGERSGDASKGEDLATLLTGAARVRLAAHSLSSMPHPPRDGSFRAPDTDALDGEARRLRSWYEGLGTALAHAQPPPAPDGDHRDGRVQILKSAREAAARGGEDGARLAVSLLWSAQQLDNLRRLESQLVDAAGRVAAAARPRARGNRRVRGRPRGGSRAQARGETPMRALRPGNRGADPADPARR